MQGIHVICVNLHRAILGKYERASAPAASELAQGRLACRLWKGRWTGTAASIAPLRGQLLRDAAALICNDAGT